MGKRAVATFCLEDTYEHVNGDVGIAPSRFSLTGLSNASVDKVAAAVVSGVLQVSNPEDSAWYFDLKGRRRYHVFSPYPCECGGQASFEKICVAPEGVEEHVPFGLLLRVVGSFRMNSHTSYTSREGVYLAQHQEGVVKGVLIAYLESHWGVPHLEEQHFALSGMTPDALQYVVFSSWKGLERKEVELNQAKPFGT